MFLELRFIRGSRGKAAFERSSEGAEAAGRGGEWGRAFQALGATTTRGQGGRGEVGSRSHRLLSRSGLDLEVGG